MIKNKAIIKTMTIVSLLFSVGITSVFTSCDNKKKCCERKCDKDSTPIEPVIDLGKYGDSPVPQPVRIKQAIVFSGLVREGGNTLKTGFTLTAYDSKGVSFRPTFDEAGTYNFLGADGDYPIKLVVDKPNRFLETYVFNSPPPTTTSWNFNLLSYTGSTDLSVDSLFIAVKNITTSVGISGVSTGYQTDIQGNSDSKKTNTSGIAGYGQIKVLSQWCYIYLDNNALPYMSFSTSNIQRAGKIRVPIFR